VSPLETVMVLGWNSHFFAIMLNSFTPVSAGSSSAAGAASCAVSSGSVTGSATGSSTTGSGALGTETSTEVVQAATRNNDANIKDNSVYFFMISPLLSRYFLFVYIVFLSLLFKAKLFKCRLVYCCWVFMARRWDTFLASVFFVLGFSTVFAAVGVLLQSVLSNVSFEAQRWLGRIGGVVIILFGLYLLGLIKPKFLEKEHKLRVKRKFKSMYATSFVFGAAFAVGWTPCVGAVLGAVLTLAATQPATAFFLLLAYSLGLGIPFLVVGLFTNEAQRWISKSSSWLKWLNYVFGAVLIAIGVLVFTSQLSRIANLGFATDLLISLEMGSVGVGAGLNLGVAFFAGFVSFLSPCVLPLIPAFLTYLASTVVKE
jgi:cytochrome c-type biogenesis protein